MGGGRRSTSAGEKRQVESAKLNKDIETVSKIEKLYSSGRYQSGRAAEDVRICTPEVLKHSNRYRTETAVLNLLETISTVSGDILSTPRVVSPDGRMRTILQDALRPR